MINDEMKEGCRLNKNGCDTHFYGLPWHDHYQSMYQTCTKCGWITKC